MDENNGRPSVSSAKLEANRRYARGGLPGLERQKEKLQSMAVHDLAFAAQGNRIAGAIVDPILERINRHFTLPLNEKLDRLLRYETPLHRQLVYTIARQVSATRPLRPTSAAPSTLGPRCEV